MLKHIVMFTLTSPEAGRQLRERLLALPSQIAEIQHCEVGLHLAADGSEDAAKAVLVSHFADTKALNTYRVHPAHQDLLAWLRDGNVESVQAVDYRS